MLQIDDWSTFSQANHRAKETDFSKHGVLRSGYHLVKQFLQVNYYIFIYTFTADVNNLTLT